MAIQPLPPAPLISDTPEDFNDKAFAFVSALENFVTEANQLGSDANEDAASAEEDRILAETAAAQAVAAAGTVVWVSGTTYAIGDIVYSPITYLSYRRKTAGAGTTDPSADSTNWAELGGTGNVTTDGTQTLTNKTLTGVKETRTTIADSPPTINLNLGSYFTMTVTGNRSFTVSNVPASGTAAAFVLELTNAGSYVITWMTGTDWDQGVAPTLTASGKDILGFYSHDGGTTWNGFLLAKDSK
jgi:hypothetical protein